MMSSHFHCVYMYGGEYIHITNQNIFCDYQFGFWLCYLCTFYVINVILFIIFACFQLVISYTLHTKPASPGKFKYILLISALWRINWALLRASWWSCGYLRGTPSTISRPCRSLTPQGVGVEFVWRIQHAAHTYLYGTAACCQCSIGENAQITETSGTTRTCRTEHAQ